MIVGAYALLHAHQVDVARPRRRDVTLRLPERYTFGAVVFFGGVIYLLWTIEMAGRVCDGPDGRAGVADLGRRGQPALPEGTG